MEIDVEQLRTVINRLLDHVVKVRGVRRVNLGGDFYWDIDQSEAYDPTQKPTEIDLGSFPDDWDFLENVREGKDIAAVQLTQVAPILRRLGEQLGESLAAKGQS
jgi:hypothetical protein